MVNFSDCIGVAINLGLLTYWHFLSLNLHGIIQHPYWFENIFLEILYHRNDTFTIQYAKILLWD